MKIRKVAFYYFSGTGNTLLIVNKMIDIFRSLNIEVNIYNMLYTKPSEISIDNTIGISFPVACFTTYPFVWDFLEAMPDGQGTDIFMVDTKGSFSGGMTGQVHQLLVRKNYNPIGAREIKMPNNINFSRYDEQKNQQLISIGLQKAKYYTHDLVYGISKWKPIFILPTLFEKLQVRRRAWTFLEKRLVLTIDNIKCIRCGLCYKLCPVNNIEMEEYPEYLGKCQFCLRCISFCPTQAISFKDKKDFYPYNALEAEELLK